MLIRRLVLPGCQRLLQQHGARISSRRCLTTDIQANEAALEAQLHAAAAAASTSTPSPQTDIGHAQPQPPRRRRRRKEQAQLPARDPVVDDYLAYQHMQRTTGSHGSRLNLGYHPSNLLRDPPSPSDITLELLLASQTHLGHSTSLWNPANSRYIFGVREGVHIISLDTTAQYLRRAAKVVSGVAERGGLILFVGTRPGFDRIVVRAAQLASPACHLFERWTPGSITNAQQILGRCGMRVVDEFDADVEGFEDQLYGRNALKPDLVICLNPIENYVMLHECALATIPTIGIIDTNADPTWVTYPIPANDDSLRSIQVICGVLGRAGEAGQKKRRDAAVAGRILYRAPDQLALPEDFDIPAFKSGKESRKAAFKSGLADVALLTDPSLGSGLAKLRDSEKSSITEGDKDMLRSVQTRLSPQERAALVKHFDTQAKIAVAVAEETKREEERKETAERNAKGQSRGSSAKDRAKAAAQRTARGAPAADEVEDEDDQEGRYQAATQGAPEDDTEDDLADSASPLEASRRAAAEAYFRQEGQASSTSSSSASDLNNEASVVTNLQRKLSADEISAIQSAPASFDLESVRKKLSVGEFVRLQTVLQEIIEAAGEGQGDVNAEADAVGLENSTARFDPEMGSERAEIHSATDADAEMEDDEEGRMGVGVRKEEVMTEMDQERQGLGHADEGDLEGTGSNTGR